MHYSLKRTRDGAGDSGPMSDALIPTFDQDTGKVVHLEQIHNARPQIGAAMRVGTMFARSYSTQDWWQTTVITKILEDTEDYVRFKTGNSEYEWRTF